MDRGLSYSFLCLGKLGTTDGKKNNPSSSFFLSYALSLYSRKRIFLLIIIIVPHHHHHLFLHLSSSFSVNVWEDVEGRGRGKRRRTFLRPPTDRPTDREADREADRSMP